MNHTPTVSVIVPNFNYARYLDGRLRSILEQTLADFELIILDDASTDGSAEVIDRYRCEPRVSHVVMNEANTGSPFRQWQRGLELARGKYVWIAEADDLAEPTLLERCVEALETNPKAVLAFAGCEIIDEHGLPGSENYDKWEDFPRKLAGGYEVFAGDDYLRHNLYWNNYIYNASGAVFRRDAVRPEVFDKISTMRNAGDWLFWADVVSRGDVVEVYEKLNRMRRHSASVTRTGGAAHPLKMYREVLESTAHVERLTSISLYRRIIRRGELLKGLRRSEFTPAQRKAARKLLAEVLGANTLHYLIERINKPLAPSSPAS